MQNSLKCGQTHRIIFNSIAKHFLYITKQTMIYRKFVKLTSLSSRIDHNIMYYMMFTKSIQMMACDDIYTRIYKLHVWLGMISILSHVFAGTAWQWPSSWWYLYCTRFSYTSHIQYIYIHIQYIYITFTHGIYGIGADGVICWMLTVTRVESRHPIVKTVLL